MNKIGLNNINRIYIGGITIGKIYLGDIEVYGDITTTTTSTTTTTTTAAPTTTTTTTTTTPTPTTTEAPLVGYSLSGSNLSEDYTGDYTISGTLQGQPVWQNSTKSYILWYQGASSGWMIFPGTISGSTNAPLGSQACGYPAGGDGDCSVELITGSYSDWSTGAYFNVSAVS
jgi:hypothetical protein